MASLRRGPTGVYHEGRDRVGLISSVDGPDRGGHDDEVFLDDEEEEEDIELAEMKMGRRRRDDSESENDCECGDEDNKDGYREKRADERKRRRRRRASASSEASFMLYTPDEERAVVRKLDRRLVVFVACLYMLSFLDRSNIGNARIAGMDEDLQSTPRRDDYYKWSLTAFYIAYIVFEWMSLLWKLIPAHVYVTLIVLSWGLTASLQALSTSYPMLIALRFLLGIGEAGFTGIPFYLSFFFRRHELAFRTAIFISAAPLATTFASSLAWVIIRVGQASPIAPWRLLFLIEGFPSVLVAVAAWHLIPDSPQTASFLSRRQRKVAVLRLRRDQPSASRRSSSNTKGDDSGGSQRRGLDLAAAASVLADPVAWITAAMFFLTNMAYSSLPVFLPLILTEMGHSTLAAQALAAPPYLSAFLVVLASAHISDRMRSRAPLLIVHALASAAGYGVLALGRLPPFRLAPGSLVRYLAVYPAAVGFFNVVVLLIAWNINNQRGESRQGAAFALFQLVGQCGPLVGTRLYPDADGPYYERGMRVMAVAMFAVALLAGLLRWYLVRQNRKLDREDEAKAARYGGTYRGDEEDDDKEEDEEQEEEEEGLVRGGVGGSNSNSNSNSSSSGERDSFRYML